jgi:hypothetical protein
MENSNKTPSTDTRPTLDTVMLGVMVWIIGTVVVALAGM